jgi:hypothetical protein
VRLPAPQRSRAVLIGTGKYADKKLPDLPVVGKTINDLAAAFTDLVHGVVPGLLHGPFARRVRGDATEMHPPGAVFNEHQEVQPLQQHGVHMQEVHREDAGRLSAQELPPRRARSARRRADAGSSQDLIDGRGRDRDAELGQLAVDPAVAPQRILFRHADDEAGDAADCLRPARPAPFASVVLPGGQPAVPGQ